MEIRYQRLRIIHAATAMLISQRAHIHYCHPQTRQAHNYSAWQCDTPGDAVATEVLAAQFCGKLEAPKIQKSMALNT